MSSRDRAKVASSFHEVMHKTPSTVKRAKVSKGRKSDMKVAIALDKARKSGVSIPYRGVKRG